MKQIVLEIKVNGANQSIKNFEQLDSTIKDLKNELATTDFGSEKFKQLSSELQKAEAASEKFNNQIKGVSATGIKLEAVGKTFEGVAKGTTASISLITGAMALFGSESAELQKALLKVQAAIAISTGIKDLTESVKAFSEAQKLSATATKASNAAMLANPYVLAAVALAALVAGIIIYSRTTNKATKEAAELRKEQERANEFYEENKSLIAQSTDAMLEGLEKGTIAQRNLNTELERTVDLIIEQAIYNSLKEQIDKVVAAMVRNQQEINFSNKVLDINNKNLKENKDNLFDLTNLTEDKTLKDKINISSTNASNDAIAKNNKEQENLKATLEGLILLWEDASKKIKSLKDNTDKGTKSTKDLKEEVVDLTDEINQLKVDLIDNPFDKAFAQLELNFKEGVQGILQQKENLTDTQFLDLVFGTPDQIKEKFKLNDQQFEDVILRIELFNKAIKKLYKEQAANITEPIDEAATKDLLSEQIDALNDFKEGRIANEEDLQRKLKEIQLNADREKLKTLKEGSVEYLQLQKSIAEQEIALIDKKNEEIKVSNQDVVNASLNSLSQIIDSFAELGSVITQNEQNEIEDRIANIEGQYDAQIAAAEAAGQSTIALEQAKTKAIAKEQEALEKLKREEFERNKAIQIVQSIINTASAIVAALSTQPFIPLGLIAAATAAAAGVANIAVIASQQYPSNGSASGGQTPTAPQMSSSSSQIPNPNGNGMYGTGAEQEQTFGSGDDSPNNYNVKIFVSETDITNTQNTVASIEQVSKF